MKNSIKIVSVALAIVMSFAAVQAFEDTEVKKSSAGPNVDENEDEVVTGCVLSLHAEGQDGITLCRDDGVEGCPVNDDNVANACDPDDCSVEDVITIQGIGPAFYWENAATLEIGDGCLPVTGDDEKYVETGETSTIPQPGPGENVKIGYYPSQDGEYLIALWVVVNNNNTEGGATATAVLLRDQATLDVLWKSVGNKTRTNSEE